MHRKGVTKANFISKNKRTKLAKKLIESKESADNLFNNTVGNETDDFLDNAANIKKFTPPKEVIRKIKSEYIKKSRLDPDPIYEIVKFNKLQQDNKINYIREICYSPFKIYMFYEKMFQSVISNKLQFKKFLDIHIDCTGSLFKNLLKNALFITLLLYPALKILSHLVLLRKFLCVMPCWLITPPFQ